MAWESVIVLDTGEIVAVATWPTEREAFEHAAHLASPFRQRENTIAVTYVPVRLKRWNGRAVASARGQA